MTVDVSLREMHDFCNSVVYEGHSERLRFVEEEYPVRSFYLMNRQELEKWFSCLSGENRAICSYCDEFDCYTCQRFHYIKSELHKCGYFVARDSKYQTIIWEIHEIFLIKRNHITLQCL